MTLLMKSKFIKCLSCNTILKNPYYVGFFTGLFSSKKDHIIKILNTIKENEEIARRIQEEKLLKEKIRIQEEKDRIKANKKLLKESYFLEEDGGKKPHSKEDITKLMSKGKIKLITRIKLGFDTEDYKTVCDFKEFNRDFKDFM
jgi:hypothetical protein